MVPVDALLSGPAGLGRSGGFFLAPVALRPLLPSLLLLRIVGRVPGRRRHDLGRGESATTQPPRHVKSVPCRSQSSCSALRLARIFYTVGCKLWAASSG